MKRITYKSNCNDYGLNEYDDSYGERVIAQKTYNKMMRRLGQFEDFFDLVDKNPANLEYAFDELSILINELN